MIIEALKQIQLRESYSDSQMAEKIGVSRGSWNRIKRERAPFGKNFLSKVSQAYPEMKDTIYIFLSGKYPSGTSSVVDVTDAHQMHQNGKRAVFWNRLRGVVLGVKGFISNRFTK